MVLLMSKRATAGAVENRERAPSHSFSVLAHQPPSVQKALSLAVKLDAEKLGKEDGHASGKDESDGAVEGDREARARSGEGAGGGSRGERRTIAADRFHTLPVNVFGKIEKGERKEEKRHRESERKRRKKSSGIVRGAVRHAREDGEK
jgi:hypothetical protein